MKNILFILFISFFTYFQITFAQFQPDCSTQQSQRSKNIGQSKSINDLKIVRINYHFMLKTDGTGNFDETSDGIGNNFSGYDYARGLTNWMNSRCLENIQMNIPPNNNIQVIPKNFIFILDEVYFHRNSSVYNYQTMNITIFNSTWGKNKDSVLNIFLNYTNGNTIGGYARNLDPNTQNKYTENRRYWQHHVNKMNQGLPIDWYYYWEPGANTKHELCHLLGLDHTVKYNYAPPCGTGCTNLTQPNGAQNPIDYNCDDDCLDTPTAWEITNLNNCSKHPDCGWGQGGAAYCSNNVMDYSGANALTPCQINIIHSYLEGGMRSYNACAAVASDKYYSDLGYPRVSYFGKNITIGNAAGSIADISQNEKLAVYFSESVEFNNFEILSGADEFEVLMYPICNF